MVELDACATGASLAARGRDILAVLLETEAIAPSAAAAAAAGMAGTEGASAAEIVAMAAAVGVTGTEAVREATLTGAESTSVNLLTFVALVLERC